MGGVGAGRQADDAVAEQIDLIYNLQHFHGAFSVNGLRVLCMGGSTVHFVADRKKLGQ